MKNLEEIVQGINPVYEQYLNNPEQHSGFFIEDDFQLLILRGLKFDAEGLHIHSYGFLIKEHNIYAYNRKDQCLYEIDNSYLGLYERIRPYYDRNHKILGSYIEEIDKVEDELYAMRAPAHFMETWFNLKKDVSRIERYYSRNIDVIDEFLEWVEKFDFTGLSEFRSIREKIASQIAQCQSQMNKLESLYNYFISIKNDRLNKNIYLLTIISGIFLPLNLIVGFFGMNTENLFFKENPFGTNYVLMILAGVFLFFIIGFPIVKFADFILSKVFGRSRIYKNISKKVENISDAFKLDL
ncbi:CorA-like protein [Bacteriovorax sp. BSW11_IV]|uniref:CorA family divalent cation transporter n=1 Tax=Bacteriovorax sp. BSW11_IV TaxID=1353529 RepID=UPI000389DAB5|nr:CorA family divalent cation transporter [Bacteriovorax sp. BSW11_IV]EQC42957.1 CorA-like protein [Bacteriovorax sp. BSW11_IV]